MTIKIAVIGDHFMRPEFFEKELKVVNSEPLDIRTQVYEWPGTPIIAEGTLQNGTEKLREFLGDPAAVAKFIGDADVFITHVAPVNATMVKELTGLKLIVVCRGGPVNIDTAATNAAGIRVVNTPGRNASAVAQYTVGAIIAQSRNITSGHSGLTSGHWRGDLYRADLTGRELHEMTIGLIGYGDISKRLIDLLMPFGSNLIVHDPYSDLSAEHKEKGVKSVDLPTLLSTSEVVSLHARLTDETRHMINSESIGMMQSHCMLVNTARGALVDYSALYEALSTGKLGSAVLDTFDAEPPKLDNPLFNLPNVTVTPHIAGASRFTIIKTAKMGAEEVRRFLADEPPLNPC